MSERGPSEITAPLVHRALTAAVVAGVFHGALDPATVRVRGGGLGTVAVLAERSSPADPADPAERAFDLVVAVDDGAPEADLPRALAAIAEMAGPRGTFALVVASEAAAALVRVARRVELPPRDDPYARALAWARARRDAPVAPSLSSERLEAIERAASAVGLALVEPDVSLHGPQLSKVKLPRTARARALLALTVTGALARPLLFVASSRAPKGGVAKAKLERLADGWVARGAAFEAGAGAVAPATLEHHALAILRDAAPGAALPFKELLREARTRHARVATSDARDLCQSLYRLSLDEAVTLSVLDPSAPLASTRPFP